MNKRTEEKLKMRTEEEIDVERKVEKALDDYEFKRTKWRVAALNGRGAGYRPSSSSDLGSAISSSEISYNNLNVAKGPRSKPYKIR